MKPISKLFIIILLSLLGSILLTSSTSLAVSIEGIKTSKVSSFNCSGQNAQGFTITPNYYVVGCGHNGPVKTYSKSNTKKVIVSKKISGDDGDLDYYAPNNYIVVGGKYFYNPSSLRQVAIAKYSLNFNASYDVGDDVFVVANHSKVEVRGNILKSKSPRLYKSFNTVHTNQGSFYHNGVFYRVIYCLRSGTNPSTCKGSNIGKGQSAVVAYDVTTGKKVGHYVTSNYDQAGELQDGGVFGGKGYVSSGGGGIYKITGPSSLLKLLGRSSPMKFNKAGTGKSTDYNDQSDSTRPRSSGGSGQSQTPSESDVKIAPEHKAQCATILSFWCNDAETDGKGTIEKIIKFVISIFTVGITVLGTIGLIYSGYLIMTARDNPVQVQKAKKRILEIVIGIVIWVLLAILIALFLPASDDVVNEVSITKQSQITKN